MHGNFTSKVGIPLAHDKMANIVSHQINQTKIMNEQCYVYMKNIQIHGELQRNGRFPDIWLWAEGWRAVV